MSSSGGDDDDDTSDEVDEGIAAVIARSAVPRAPLIVAAPDPAAAVTPSHPLSAFETKEETKVVAWFVDVDAAAASLSAVVAGGDGGI